MLRGRFKAPATSALRSTLCFVLFCIKAVREQSTKEWRMQQWTALKVDYLRTVHKSRSYKRTHGTFRRFCREEFNIGKSYAYRIISGERCRKRPISAELRWEIWERDDFRCAYCGKRRFLSVDHIKPEKYGGTLDKANLVTACMKCNLKRGAGDGSTMRTVEGSIMDFFIEMGVFDVRKEGAHAEH